MTLNIFCISPENNDWHFIQMKSIGEVYGEMSIHIFSGKSKKNVSQLIKFN